MQSSVASPLQWVRRLSHPLVQCIDIKTTRSRGSEAGLRILRKLLRSQQAIRALQTAPKPNLLRAQIMFRDEPALLCSHRLFGYSAPAIRRLHPPRKEVPHHAVLRIRLIRRRTPLVVERAIRSVRRTLQHHLSLRSKRSPQSRERHRSIAGPAAHLAAMQVLHTQPTTCIQLRGAQIRNSLSISPNDHLPRIAHATAAADPRADPPAARPTSFAPSQRSTPQPRACAPPAASACRAS